MQPTTTAETLDTTAPVLMPLTAVETIAIIEQSLLFLAGRCDGARSRDGVGFNGTHTRFGHRTADQIEGKIALTPPQLRKALMVLRMYHKTQLVGGGFDRLPSDTELEAAIVERRALTAYVPKSKREQAPAPAPKAEIAREGEWLNVRTPYDPDKLARFKAAVPTSERRYVDRGVWLVRPQHGATVEAIYNQ